MSETATRPRTLKDLRPKQRRFIREYLNNPIASEAALKAGFSPKTAKEQGYQCFTKLHTIIAPLLEQQEKRIAEQSGISKERWIKEVQRIAFHDIRAMFDPETGEPLDISKLSLDEAAAIVSFESNPLFVGHGNDRQAVGVARKFKLADKLKALELFGKATGYYVERVEVEEKGPLAKLATAVLLKMQQELERQVTQVEHRPAPIEIGTNKP